MRNYRNDYFISVISDRTLSIKHSIVLNAKSSCTGSKLALKTANDPPVLAVLLSLSQRFQTHAAKYLCYYYCGLILGE